MKKTTLFFAVLLLVLAQAATAQLFTFSSGKVDFFSKGPVDDIDAHNPSPKIMLNVPLKTIAVVAENTAFVFQNKLMQEHYNEKYVESEKYPLATFQGKINEDVDLAKDGVYTVTVTGKFKLHGVEKERTIPGTIMVKSGQITVKSVFKVSCADHNITIPSVIGAKISETVDVTVDAVLIPKK
jgi:hypothetical protein